MFGANSKTKLQAAPRQMFTLPCNTPVACKK